VSARDVIIIGSGPAGLTAAVYAARANLAPLVIEGEPSSTSDQPGGQLMLTTEVENYPGFPKGIMGPELMDGMRKQAERFGTHFITGSVTSAALGSRPFVLKTSIGEIQTDALIIATGARAKWLGIDEEFEFRTKIGGVSACATCDGFFYKNKHVLVVGGGDTAMEEALFLTKFASTVTVVHRREEFRASKVMQTRVLEHPKIEVIWNAEVSEIVGTDAVTGVRLRDVHTAEITERPVDGVFVAIGHDPNTDLFRGALGTDDDGYLQVQEPRTLTNIPGVFAAGDVTDRVYRQAVTAAGQGCKAAIDAERYLESRAHQAN
jgi:thioredoxin reductase (NADPH)